MLGEVEFLPSPYFEPSSDVTGWRSWFSGWRSWIPNSSPSRTKAYSKGLNSAKFEFQTKTQNVVPNFGVGRLCPLVWGMVFIFWSCNSHVWPTDVGPFRLTRSRLYILCRLSLSLLLYRRWEGAFVFVVWCEVDFIAKSTSFAKVLLFLWR
jgi:hypothetical protein